MKKLLCLCLILLLCMTAGCRINYPVNESTGEEITSGPIHLEVIFGNGESFTTTVAYFLIPATSGNDYCNGVEIDKYTYSSFYASLGSIQSALADDKRIYLSGAILMDGSLYSFHDVKTYSIDTDTATVSVELWRDEPYTAERAFFME